MADEWITVKEAAELLKRSRRHVVSMIHAGKLKAKRDGRLWLIHSSLLEPEEAELPPKDLPKEAVRRLEEEVEYLKEQVQQRDRQLEEKDQQLQEARERYDIQMERLQEELGKANAALSEASHRHDTVVMQMTRLLEYHQQPFWKKLFQRKQLPPSMDETIMDMKTGSEKETDRK